MAVLCVDIGGTLIKYGLLSESGKLLSRNAVETPKNLNDFKLLLRSFVDGYRQRIDGIALCAPAMVIYDEKAFYNCEGLPFINGISMKEIFGPANKDLPITVENEGMAATTAELWNGSLNGIDSGILLTLGSGVTGGFVVNGELVRGAHHQAGLFSLIRDELNVRGTQGLVRSNCSAVNMIRAINRVAGNENELDGIAAFEKIKSGDKNARDIFAQFCKNIAQLLFNMQLTMDVQRFVIGGGISNEKIVLKTIKQKYTEIVSEFPQAQQVLIYPELVKSEYSNGIGLYGAFYSYMQQMNGEIKQETKKELE